MKVAITQNPRYLLVRLDGNFDANWASAVGDRIEFSLQEYSRGQPLDIDLVIDLGGVAYISSGAIRVLLTLQRKMEGAGRKLALCDPGPQVSQVMQLSGLYDLLAFYPSPDAAARALEGYGRRT